MENIKIFVILKNWFLVQEKEILQRIGNMNIYLFIGELDQEYRVYKIGNFVILCYGNGENFDIFF